MRNTIESVLLVFAAPFYIMDHYLSYLWLYRRLWGGHWEKWDLRYPGLKRSSPEWAPVWIRIKREDCYRMTGKRLGAHQTGSPYCEEKGKCAYESATYCECGRDLTRAPGCVGSHEGDPETSAVVGYSCPCGRWPRFVWGLGWQYLGDLRDTKDTV